MVTIYNISNNTLGEKNKLMVELRGLSTDTKPTALLNGEIENGSSFIEMDTQDLYFYDGENEEWVTPTDEEQEEPQEPQEPQENVGD